MGPATLRGVTLRGVAMVAVGLPLPLLLLLLLIGEVLLPPPLPCGNLLLPMVITGAGDHAGVFETATTPPERAIARLLCTFNIQLISITH